jgi:hypothetical protein
MFIIFLDLMQLLHVQKTVSLQVTDANDSSSSITSQQLPPPPQRFSVFYEFRRDPRTAPELPA